ncbi:MAG: SUMF1/EgtB/PvdO family nonheme iron enzyme [Polyangiaceae bacterium]|nr:SUMF1/EgtB/PvdO family nonheme iron enzyme [Polyangiaceae bacterium]
MSAVRLPPVLCVAVLAWPAACARGASTDGVPLPAPPALDAPARDAGIDPLPEPLPSAAPTASPDAGAAPSGRCPDDMAFVDGDYCPGLERTCLRPRKSWQCAEWAPALACPGATERKRYCIDRYEWPNREGALATVMNSWHDARKLCASAGKRLCTEAEWTLACEGPERLGFPYGEVRDADACPIDKISPIVNEERLFSPATRDAELARLDQREPSGARPRCVSPYGVHDLTGNVDEWVDNETGQPFKGSLKGGNWGEYRNACRPVTRGHAEGFRYYQTGFRCCRAPLAD